MTSLHQASENGHTEVVKSLIRCGATVNECNNVNMTPLHLAAQNGHTSTVEILLDNHAAVDITNESKKTPLYLAAEKGHAEVVDVLLRRHVSDFIIATGYESTPLHAAVKKRHAEVVKVFLKHSRSTFDKLSEDKLKENVRNLVEIKDIEPVELKKGDGRRVSAGIVWAEINTPLQLIKHPDGYDALELAVYSCQPKMVEILFDTDHYLYSVKYLGNVFDCLIGAIDEYGADGKYRCRNTDEEVELKYRNFKGIVDVLVKSDRFNVNYQWAYLSTPLHEVLEICDPNFNDHHIKRSKKRLLKIQIIDYIMKLLLEKGADFNMKNAIGKTALIIASGRSCIHAIQILLEWEQKSGTILDLDARDQYGATALITAADEYHVDGMKLLLNNKASVNLYDYYGFTALHRAVYWPNRSWAELQFLIKRLCQKTIKIDDFREDRLRKSVEQELKWFLGYNKETTGIEQELVDLLLDNDETTVNVKDFRGNTPLDLAVESTMRINSATINKLQNRGAIQLQRESNDEPPVKKAKIDESHLCPFHQLAIYHLLNCATEVKKAAKREMDNERFDLMLCGLLHRNEKLGQITTALDSKGRTPLHCAVMPMFYDVEKDDGDQDLVNVLLELGFSVNATDIYGKTPLHYAKANADYQLLVARGADENIKDNYGYTPRDFKRLRDSTEIERENVSKLYTSRKLKPNHVKELTKLKLPVAIRIFSQSPRCPESTEERVWKIWSKNNGFLLNRRARQLKTLLQRFMERLAGSIKEKDSRFECQPNLVGSAEEETRVNVSADFDYNMKLTKFSDLCDVFPHPLGPEGYFQLKRKSKDDTKSLNDEDFDCFFNSDQCLLTKEVNSRFQFIIEEVLNNPNFWKDEGLFEWIITCIDKRKRIDRTGLVRGVQLRMIHPTDDGFQSDQISIDIVACVYMKGWWPGDQVAVSISPALKAGGCMLVFDRPKFDPSKKRLDYIDDCFPFCETFARFSFAPVESRIIKESSALTKAAYMVCKMILSDIEGVTYQLKNCLLFCMEALNASNGSETRNEEDITPKELAFWVERIMFCFIEFCRYDSYPCYLMPAFRQLVIRDYKPRLSASKAIAPSYNEIPFEYSYAYDIYLDICPDDTAIDIAIVQRHNGYIEECLDTIRDPLWKQFVKKELLSKLSFFFRTNWNYVKM